MVETPSTMLELGTTAPEFALEDLDGKTVRRDDVKGPKGLLVMFICNHCPFVKHVAKELGRLGKEYPEKGIGVVAINSNDIEKYTDDRPEKMAEFAKDNGFTFPYLLDEDQSVAKTYRAACTPDFFLFNSEDRLVYRGQLDDSRPGNDKPVDGKDLRAAMDALIEDRPVPENQAPSIGCNIKWKPGNEPEYFTS